MSDDKDTTLVTFDTEYSADSVEWCPISPYQHVFVCGTYQLCKSGEAQGADEAEAESPSTERKGRLYLFKFMDGQLITLQTIECAAILDQKWCIHTPSDLAPMLAVAFASGHVIIYHLEETDHSLHLVEKHDIIVAEGGLALSLDWSSGKESCDAPAIVVSNSLGQITSMELFSPVHTWDAHGYEAWICAYDYWDTNVVLSGGDDCKLKGWDKRFGFSTPIFSSRRHSMGVCSLHSNQHKDHIYASGSYDEHVMLWDRRSMKSCISDTVIGGGVWRLKWSPHNSEHLLCAGMHNGFHILDCKALTDSQPIIASYMKHNSLAYGSDWCHLVSGDNSSNVVASCSFYDHTLRLWTVEM